MPLNTSKEYYVKCFNEGVVAYHNETACKYNSKHYKAKAWKEGWTYEDDQQLNYEWEIFVGNITAEEADAAKKAQVRVFSEKAKALFREIKIDEIIND